MPQTARRCDEIIGQLHRTVSQVRSRDETVGAVKDLMTAALEETGWLPERCTRSSGACYARHLLHMDSEKRFCVVVMVWGPGQKTPIHDHGGVWCVEGVYEGKIRVHRYDLDGPAEGGLARLHPCEVIDAGTGTTGALIPPVDYHLIANESDRTAVTVHTYGGEMRMCHVYLPRPDGAYDVRAKELVFTSVPDSAGGGWTASRG